MLFKATSPKSGLLVSHILWDLWGKGLGFSRATFDVISPCEFSWLLSFLATAKQTRDDRSSLGLHFCETTGGGHLASMVIIVFGGGHVCS